MAKKRIMERFYVARKGDPRSEPGKKSAELSSRPPSRDLLFYLRSFLFK